MVSPVAPSTGDHFFTAEILRMICHNLGRPWASAPKTAPKSLTPYVLRLVLLHRMCVWACVCECVVCVAVRTRPSAPPRSPYFPTSHLLIFQLVPFPDTAKSLLSWEHSPEWLAESCVTGCYAGRCLAHCSDTRTAVSHAALDSPPSQSLRPASLRLCVSAVPGQGGNLDGNAVSLNLAESGIIRGQLDGDLSVLPALGRLLDKHKELGPALRLGLRGIFEDVDHDPNTTEVEAESDMDGITTRLWHTAVLPIRRPFLSLFLLGGEKQCVGASMQPRTGTALPGTNNNGPAGDTGALP